jgi:hypothetical protein
MQPVNDRSIKGTAPYYSEILRFAQDDGKELGQDDGK